MAQLAPFGTRISCFDREYKSLRPANNELGSMKTVSSNHIELTRLRRGPELTRFSRLCVLKHFV